jgi:peptidoglycan/xylan/chitin deacetylase (PgdA/CDA1 family)
MSRHATRAPFSERGGRLRGLLDVASGCYPAFLFGGSIGSLLPVFHLHETSVAALEPRLRYLADNGYQTVTSDAVARLVRDRVHPGPRRVVLCFDDAWASLWTTAGPLLRRYGFTAVTFAIPARIIDAPSARPTIDDGAEPAGVDRSDRPFVSWPELRALHDSGTIDVQSHSWSHSMIFSDATAHAFVTPAYAQEPLLNRPRVAAGDATGTAEDGRPAFLTPDNLGAPLYARRSRLSDAWRHVEDPRARDRCIEHVRANGGPAFFDRAGWADELRAVHDTSPRQTRVEDAEARERSIRHELERARDDLNARLGGPHVRHVCAPWGIAGTVTRRAARALGFETLYADRVFGRRAVRAGDDPFGLMRLHERFIGCLPGRGRRFFHTAA